MTSEYDSPPVTEAVLGIEFAPLGLGLIRLAHMHDLWIGEFPVASEVQALSPSLAAGQPSFALPFELMGAVPPVRFWFQTQTGEWLIQLQDDRLILNWRKRSGNTYPHYSELRRRFGEYVSEFLERLKELNVVPIQVTVTEFTYFNRLQPLAKPSDFYSLFSTQPDDLPGELLVTRFDQVRNLSAEKYGANGQVNLTSQPIVDEQGSGTQLVITAKFFPAPSDFNEGVWALLDSGHAVARTTFEQLTREDVQRDEWGLR